MSEYLDDLAYRCRPPFRVFHDFSYDLLAVDRPAEAFARDKQILVDPFVIRDHETKRFVILEYPHHLGYGTVYDAHDLAFQLAAARAFRADAHQHGVSIHRAFQIIRMDVYVGMVAILRDQKCKPFGMGLQTAAHQIHPFRNAVTMSAG
ncbi:hypothetical protein D3C74_268000 [compost metagenome]